jgi:hypothetical protein
MFKLTFSRIYTLSGSELVDISANLLIFIPIGRQQFVKIKVV